MFNLGHPDSVGHKGTITLNDNAPIESVILAYQVVRKLALAITQRMNHYYKKNDQDKKQVPVLIHNPTDFSTLSELHVFRALATDFETMFKGLIDEANQLEPHSVPDETGTGQQNDFSATIAVAAIGGLISSGLQLASLFRADHEIKNFSVVIEDQVLAMTVAGQLVQNEFKVLNSAITPASPFADSEVMKSLARLNTDRSKLNAALLILQSRGIATPAEGGSASSTQSSGQTSPSHQSGPRLGAAPNDKDTQKRADLVARIKDALKSFDSFRDGLSKVDDKTGTPPITRVLAGELLHSRLKTGVYVLWLKAVAAGGAVHAKVSTFDNSVTYSGGAVICYAIFDGAGNLLEADTIPMHGGKAAISGIEDMEFELSPLAWPKPQFFT
jgi:hypothetical protein